MIAHNRIIINTIAQYIRSIINMGLSLYSSRLVLNILGVEDYGIYMLIAGVVSMLSFLTNSLVRSTQRFLSVIRGKGDIHQLKEVFSNSLLLHIIIGLCIAIVLISLTPFIFNTLLNIPIDRIVVAKNLYIMVIIMVYTSFVTSPYRALLVSRENIVYTSIVDVIDGVLKVLLVLALPYLAIDKLLAYGIIMLCIQLFNLFACMIYSYIKYEECVCPKFSLFNFSYVKDICSFTGWVVYSSICITLRIQGFAIVLNNIFGAAMNAAYGIGAQISGMISFISASFSNAIAPQLMAAEGQKNREKMFILAVTQSKVSFLLLSMIGIPTMFEMNLILELWLVRVPDYTMLFGCMFLSLQIVDMLSIGLDLANKAIGNIGRYTIITYTPKLLTLPLSWIALKLKMPLISVVILMFSVETMCMLLRISLFKGIEGFNVRNFYLSVIIKSLPPVVICIFVCALLQNIQDDFIRFMSTYFFSIPLFLMSVYFLSLSNQEKQFVKLIVIRFIGK